MAIVLLSVFVLSGCTQSKPTTEVKKIDQIVINSEPQASAAKENISSEIEGVNDDLRDIDDLINN